MPNPGQNNPTAPDPAPEKETRFQANARRRRSYAFGATALTFAILAVRDGTISGMTILVSLGVFLAFEGNAYFRGIRALSVSSTGITIEKSMSGRVVRLLWRDLERVEVQRQFSGQVWTFQTKDNRSIRWSQSGFEGDRRVELERTLASAIRKHGINLSTG